MKINALIDRNFNTTSILEDTRDVSNYLTEVNYLAVMDEDMRLTGIVTLRDIHTHPESRNLLDCDITKPRLSPEHTIFEAFIVMQDTGYDFLPVYDKDNFIGVVSLMSITGRFSEALTEIQKYTQRAAHDLRNPISNLKSLLQLLNTTTVDQENHDLIKLCSLSCKHAIDIVDDMVFLEMDDNRPLIKEPTDMNTFYEQCVSEQTGLSLLKNIKLETRLCHETVVKEIDRNLFKRAVQNVISNAIKFSHSSSIIKITTSTKADKIIFKIVDAGIGIPEKDQPEIFKRFTTAGRPGTNDEPSTGLGLCFSKQCIEQHGGSISFKSTEGKGTKFHISL